MRTHTFDMRYEFLGPSTDKPLNNVALRGDQIDNALQIFPDLIEKSLPGAAVTRDADNKWRFYVETTATDEEVDGAVSAAASASMLLGERITGI